VSDRSPPDRKRELLHVLAARLGLDLDTRVQEIVGIGELQPAGSTREKTCEQLAEVTADVGKRTREHRLDLGVDRCDHSHQFAACAANVFQLLLEELVALLQFIELLESERIDRPHQSEFTLQIPDSSRVSHTFGNRRHLGGFCSFGFDIEFAPKHVDRTLEAKLHFCFFDLCPPRPLPQFLELALARNT